MKTVWGDPLNSDSNTLFYKQENFQNFQGRTQFWKQGLRVPLGTGSYTDRASELIKLGSPAHLTTDVNLISFHSLNHDLFWQNYLYLIF